MAPELLRGEEPTTKTDVYAFGVTVWEIFARQDPYEVRKKKKQLLRILAGSHFSFMRRRSMLQCPVLPS